MNTDNFNKPKSNTNKSKVVLIIILLLILGLNATLYIWMNKPKNVFISSLNVVYKEALDFFNDMKDDRISNLSKTNLIKYDTNISMVLDNNSFNTTEDTIADFFEKLKLNYEYSIDKKNRLSFLDFNVLFDNEHLLNLKTYSNNDSLYFYVSEIFDKYIYIEDVDISSIYDNSDSEDIEYIVNKLKTSLIKNLENNYFETSNVTIEVDNRKIKTKKNTFMLTDDILKEIIINVLTDIKRDEKTLEILVDLSNTTFGFENISKSELIEIINNSIEELGRKGSEKILENDGYFSIYVRGILNTPIKYQILTTSTDYFGKRTEYEISYLTYTNDKNKNIKEFIYKIDNINIFKFVSESIDENIKYSLDFYDDYGDEYLKLIFDVEKNTKEIVRDKEYDVSTIFTFVVKSEEELTLRLNIDTKITIGGKINEISKEDIVNIDDLTEEEIEDINEKLWDFIFNIIGTPLENSIDDEYYYYEETEYDLYLRMINEM